jgi:hypothetical protein
MTIPCDKIRISFWLYCFSLIKQWRSIRKLYHENATIPWEKTNQMMYRNTYSYIRIQTTIPLSRHAGQLCSLEGLAFKSRFKLFHLKAPALTATSRTDTVSILLHLSLHSVVAKVLASQLRRSQKKFELIVGGNCISFFRNSAKWSVLEVLWIFYLKAQSFFKFLIACQRSYISKKRFQNSRCEHFIAR